MKKHILHALALSSPFLIVALPLFSGAILELIGWVFFRIPINIEYLTQNANDFGIPGLLLFLISFSSLTLVYSLASIKSKVSQVLVYIFIWPMLATIYTIIVELDIAIIDGKLSWDIGDGGLGLIIMVPILSSMIATSYLYFYLSYKKVKEIYNNK